MGYYHTAQICLNGHVITNRYDKNPQFRQNFCDKCGSRTITTCQNCNTNIRGDYEVESVLRLSTTLKPAPAYCFQCGHPYPWTESALESAQILISEDENLSEDEKEKFCETLPDLLVESPTPKTKVSTIRFKKFFNKVASYTAEGLKDIFVDIASETIKKSLGF